MHRRHSLIVRFRAYTGLGRSFEDTALVLLIASIFLHWALCALLTLFYAFFLLLSPDKLKLALQPKWFAVCVWGFLAFEILISVIRGNYLSAGLIAGISIFLLPAFWVRSFMTRRRFARMLDLCLYCGLISGFLQLVPRFLLSREEWERSYFLPMANANYYGLLLSMLILFAVFRILQTFWRHKPFFYLFSILCNIFFLHSTACRAAQVGTIVGVMLLLLFFGYYKTFGTACGVFTAGATLVYTLRDHVSTYYSALYVIIERTQLWKLALEALGADPFTLLFGRGLLSFQPLWERSSKAFWNVRGIIPLDSQPHCHNFFLEILLSVGVCGFLFFAFLFLNRLRLAVRRAKDPAFKPYAGFLLILCLTVALANLVDFSLFWVQTGLLLLLCFSALGIPGEQGKNGTEN